jgi:type I restriction enzyme S subunit
MAVAVDKNISRAGYRHTKVGFIPTDWDVAVLGTKVNKVGSGITPTGGERVYKKEGHPFLRSQNIGWGELIMEDIAYIDDTTHESFSGTEVRAGDVFLNITGASIGRSAIADVRLVGGNVRSACLYHSYESGPTFSCFSELFSAFYRWPAAD